MRVQPSAISALAQELLAAGHAHEAVDLLQLVIQLEPSGGAWTSLAEAHDKAGQRQQSLEDYRKDLELDSGNIMARQRLEALTSSK